MSMTDPTILQLLEKADCRYTLVGDEQACPSAD